MKLRSVVIVERAVVACSDGCPSPPFLTNRYAQFTHGIYEIKFTLVGQQNPALDSALFNPSAWPPRMPFRNDAFLVAILDNYGRGSDNNSSKRCLSD